MLQAKFPLERTLDGFQNLSREGDKEETSYSYEKSKPICLFYTHSLVTEHSTQ